ncbi:MAG TPA: hypothetical protein VNB22_02125 [Pyrinomonadaceae bacterium]|jgi:hypothetical protein|nr:hypothetical protein [Pyrinomonadaceae bacterium]
MKRFCQYSVLGIFLVFLLGFGSCQPNTPQTSNTNAPASNSAPNSNAPKSTAQVVKHAAASFPDFGFMVSPADYLNKYSSEPIFRLKADFPTELPPDSSMPAFMKIDFKTNPKEWIMAVRDYSFEGNLPNWDPFANQTRQWYHIPWLHPNSESGYPPNGGTEGFRGLIKEAPLSKHQLSETQEGENYQVYAITLINEYAGYTMGQMWKDPDNPNPGATDKRYGGGFPNGTVFAKLLFTDAPEGTDKIDFLENPLSWNVYITENWKSPNRVVKKVNLLQMDIAVRDSRADSATGWVFGTFAYNGKLNNPNKFLNLVPVGVMWGNDPTIKDNNVNPFPPKPVDQIENKNLKETIVFPSPDLPPQHLGWNSRLNGPADLNTASCLSCHITAEYPAATSLVADGMVPDGGPTPPPQGGTDPWMIWFQNIPAATPMNKETYSTDFSFQVAIALENFFDVKNARYQGMWYNDYKIKEFPISRDGGGDENIPKFDSEQKLRKKK